MKLNYKKVGEDGTPLIILHGFLGSLDNWFSLGKRFSGKHQVYLIDARNHGKSGHSNDFSYDLMANDLLEFVLSKKLEKIALIGHSMGGKAAMQFSLENPSLVEKLIVVDIAPKPYPVHHRELIDALLKLELSELSSRKEADDALSKSIPELGVRQFLLKNLDRKSKGGFEWKLNLPTLSEQIKEVGTAQVGYSTVPCLFIRGEKSNYISDGDETDILSIFPNATFASLPAGHWVHAEQTDLFFETVSDFLNR